MADLIDRLTFDENITGRPKIGGHDFSGTILLVSVGAISKAEVVAEWDLQGDELTQANALIDAIEAKVTAEEKHRQAHRFIAVSSKLNAHSPRYVTGLTIDKVQVQADAGF